MQVVEALQQKIKSLQNLKLLTKTVAMLTFKPYLLILSIFPVVEVVLAVSTGLLVSSSDQQIDAGLLVAFMLFLKSNFSPHKSYS